MNNKNKTSDQRKSRSQMYEVWSRLKKNKLAMTGLIFIVVLILIAIFADVLVDYDTQVIAQDIVNKNQGPSLKHLCGTDELGRDILARLCYGTRYTLLLSFLGNVFGLIVGGILGIVAGLSGKVLDTIIMRIVDILLAIPAILLAIAIVSAFGSSIPNIIIALSVTSVPIYARIMRSAVLSVGDLEYIEAARAIGNRTPAIVFSHILPNCLSSIIVNITINMASLIMATSVLGFIGLGVPAPTPEWGGMVSAGRAFIRDAAHLTLFPGLAITITIIAFNIAGDGLRDAFDPKLKYTQSFRERLQAKFEARFGKERLKADLSNGMGSKILEIKNLSVQFASEGNPVQAVNGLSLSIDRGGVLGLVGETGAGKTTTALSMMNMIKSPPGKIISGTIALDNNSILEKTPNEMTPIRGNMESMIFQDPMTALNPTKTVEFQIAEVIKNHKKCSKKEAFEQARDMLEVVGIPRTRGGEYPYQFSGGMKQRVVIAIALACQPDMLIADEPTTALDVTIQAQILDKMKELQKEYGTSMLMITHDLGIVAETCDSVAIIYAGSVIEYGTTEDIFNHCLHPYTVGLFGALPNVNDRTQELKPIPGLMADPSNLPEGCAFCDRCEYATEKCRTQKPEVTHRSETHTIVCHLYNNENIKKGRAF